MVPALTSDDASMLPPSMIERMTLIMDSFDGPQTRLTLEEVSGRTNLPRSTAHRIMEQLVKLRWLERIGRDYGLGRRALGLGGKESGHGALRSAAFPVLQALAMRTEMVVHLAVLEGADVYYLDKFGGRAAAEIPSFVGKRMPAYCTAAGKAILAWLPPERVDLRYPSALPRRTARSIGDIGMLHQELNRVRARRGLAFERGECVPSIACVGAALRGPDGPLGAISIVGDVHAPLERLAPLALSAAQAVTDKIPGGSPERHRPRETTFARAGVVPSETLGKLVALGERGDWL